MFGYSLPTWLINPGPVLLQKNSRTTKHYSDVQRVDLLEANPVYANIGFDNEREGTVALRHIAPAGAVHETGVQNRKSTQNSSNETEMNDT